MHDFDVPSGILTFRVQNSKVDCELTTEYSTTDTIKNKRMKIIIKSWIKGEELFSM